MSKETAIRVSVGDVYVAEITETNGEITYGTPEVLAGTSTMGVAMERGNNSVYESGKKIHENTRVSSAELTLETHTMSLVSEAKYIHGLTVTENGDVLDGPDDAPKKCAIGWAAPRSDGSSLCTWFLYTTPSKGNESYETATDTDATPNDSYNFDAVARPDIGKLRRRKICQTQSEVTAFFASVMPASGT